MVGYGSISQVHQPNAIKLIALRIHKVQFDSFMMMTTTMVAGQPVIEAGFIKANFHTPCHGPTSAHLPKGQQQRPNAAEQKD